MSTSGAPHLLTRAKPIAIIASGAAGALGFAAARAPWTADASQSDFLAGVAQAPAPPTQMLSAAALAASCMAVALVVCGPRARVLVCALAGIASLAAATSVAVFAVKSQVPVATVVLAGAGCSISALVGCAVAWTRPSWPGFSARYQRPAASDAGQSAHQASARATAVSVSDDPWRALDAGVDPTE